MTTETLSREQFLAERRKGMGGSDIAAALGLDFYITPEGVKRYRKTPYQLFLEKTGQADDEVKNVDAIRRGNFLEAAALRAYAARMQPAKMEAAIPHGAEGGWRRGNQDGRATYSDGTRAVVEIKTCSKWLFDKEWGEPGTDQVPDKALCQGHWYGNLDNSHRIDFAVVIMPDDPDKVLGRTADEVLEVSRLEVYSALRNADVEQGIIEGAQRFWKEHVLTLMPPDCEPGTDDVDLRYPQTAKDTQRPLTKDMLEKLRVYHSLGTLTKEMGERRNRLRDELLIFAGVCEALCDANGSPLVTMKTGTRAGYTVEPTTTRTVRMTKWWDKLLAVEQTAKTAPANEEAQS